MNVLVALFNPDHIHHDTAHDWFAKNHTRGWATCPLTEQGVVRILANPKYWSEFERTSALVERLARFCSSRHHHFWSDIVSLRDRDLFDLSYISGHRQLTDVYLLGLAKKMKGRLATFDQTIPLKAVIGASKNTVAVISRVE